MRTLLILWLGPIAFFWGWYSLSFHDISLGTAFFSRETHDRVFGLYSLILGIEPELIPPMVAKTLAVDSLIVLAIIAFRKRKAIAAFVRARMGNADQSAGQLSADSLSKAP